MIGLSDRLDPRSGHYHMFIGTSPDTFAYQCGKQYCLIPLPPWNARNHHHYFQQRPNGGATEPEWNGLGDVLGCGLVLDPKGGVAIFFTGNGQLIGVCFLGSTSNWTGSTQNTNTQKTNNFYCIFIHLLMKK